MTKPITGNSTMTSAHISRVFRLLSLRQIHDGNQVNEGDDDECAEPEKHRRIAHGGSPFVVAKARDSGFR